MNYYKHTCINCGKTSIFQAKPCDGIRSFNSFRCQKCDWNFSQRVLLAGERMSKCEYKCSIQLLISEVMQPCWGVSFGKNRNYFRQERLSYLNRKVQFPLDLEEIHTELLGGNTINT